MNDDEVAVHAHEPEVRVRLNEKVPPLALTVCVVGDTANTHAQTGGAAPPAIWAKTFVTDVGWSHAFTRYRRYSCVQTASPSRSTKVEVALRLSPVWYLVSNCCRKFRSSFRGGNETASGVAQTA